MNRRTKFDTFTRARSSVFAVLAVAALGLTACGGDADGEPDSSASPATSAVASETATPTPTPSATPEYKPASADGPAENVPVPKMPAAATDMNHVGLEAFARHWYDLLNYAYESGDTAPIRAITSEDCERCNGVWKGIQEWDREDSWTVGGEVKVVQVSSNFSSDPAGNYQLPVQIQHAHATNYEEGGKESVEEASAPTVDLFIAKHDGASWNVQDIGVVEQK